MFLGQFNHSLDEKSRTSIPKKFRQQIKNGGVLTRGFEGCLFLYSYQEWEKLSAQVNSLPLTARDARNFSRYLYSNAQEIKFDRLGRVVIPDYLAQAANLKRDLVINGVGIRIEIWAKENWELLNKEINTTSEETAEKLSGSGI